MSSLPRPSKADVVSDFRRAQILDAARQNFIRHGVVDTTVDGIARTAGVAKGTVYLYYKSKDEILRQVLTADLGELHNETVPLVTGPGTLDERLRGFLGAVLAFFERKRDFIEHCQIEMSPDVRKKARQKLGLVFEAQTEAWRTALVHGVSEGTVRVADPAGAARGIVSLAQGVAIQRLRGWQTGTVDEAVAWCAPLILQGVAAK